MTALIPSDEAQRLDLLRGYGIMDSPPEAAFDDITALAADSCETPFALVSLVDGSRLWIKSKVGLPVMEIPREKAFCTYALGGRDLMLVPDTLEDGRFADNPLVLGEPGIRFYAGAPLLTPGGEVLGTLCVMDRVPRQLSERQQRALQVLSKQVMNLIQSRREVQLLERTQESLLRTVAEREESDTALRRSENEQRRLAELLIRAQAAGKVGSWVMDVPTLESEWSAETHRIFETSPELFKPSYAAFFQLVHPDDLEAVTKVFDTSLSDATPCSVTHRVLMPDGRVKYVEERWQTFFSEEGQPLRVIGTSQDITDRTLAEINLQRLNRLYAISSGINEAIVRITDTQKLYTEACRIAVEQGGLLMAWVGLAEADSQSLKPVAFHGRNAGYLDFIKVSLRPEPLGLGPAGRAFRENQTAFSNDVATDPRMAPWREEAMSRGYHACSSFPLRIAGQPIGALTVYGDSAGYFTDQEFQFLTAIADDLSFAVESHQREQQRVQMEAALRASEASMASAQHIGHLGSWELDLAGAKDGNASALRWSDEMFRIAGYEPGAVVPSQKLVYRQVPVYDQELIRMAVEEAVRERCQCSFEHRLVRPDGTERIVQQTVKIFFDEISGEPVNLIGTALDVTEERLSQEALKASEERFRSFMAHSPVAGWITDAGGRFRYLSPGYYRMFGFSEDDLTGRTVNEIYDSALADIYTDNNRLVLEQQRATENVLPGVRRDGSAGEFLVVKFPIIAPGQEPLVGSLALDVTEHRKAEKTLTESEARFRSYFELPLHGIAINSPAKGWIQANDRICSILGYPRDELMTMSWAEITYAEDLEGDLLQFGRLMSGEIDQYELEKRFVRKDGRVIWTSIAVGGVRNPDGSLAYSIGVLSDIDERKQAEEILREQATLLDKAQDAIIVHDLNDRILYWNHSAERLYGSTAAESVGRPIKQLLYHDSAAFLHAKEKTLSKGEWVGEIQQCSSTGQLLVVEGRWTLVRDDHGRPKSILTINTDITERKNLEQQFLRAQRMESIGTLAGGIAHDLNNVLAPILMSIELLRMEETNPRRLGILTTIESSTRRGADMIKQVLSFARGVMEQQDDVRVGSLLEEIEKIINETFLKNIRVNCTIPADLWTVQGDPTQLHQVVLNLCVNARDAMPEGGTLGITASNAILDEVYAAMNIEAKPGPYLIIEVADSGAGMPPAVMERIFEPFYTTKEQGKGTGLGLSTSQAIVKAHGGFIRVESDGASGTKFSVYLPAHTASGAPAEAPVLGDLPQGAGELVMVVDDEAAVRQITRETLETFGYRVLQASDGVEAIALYTARQDEIDVVLTDMMMPVMDGPTMILVLTRLNPQVRIIAASGLYVDSMRAKASAAGVRHFLPKPYAADAMLRALRDLVQDKPPQVV